MKSVAVDYGGEFISSVGKIVESCGSRQAGRGDGDTHAEEEPWLEPREAISQIVPKALGLNVGEKLA